MHYYELRGGARIGIFNASYPLAKLSVNRSELEIKAFLIGHLVFKPTDIISIERHVVIPFIGQGIKINHTVGKYKKKVIFWTFKDLDQVIQNIKRTGFLK